MEVIDALADETLERVIALSRNYDLFRANERLWALAKHVREPSRGYRLCGSAFLANCRMRPDECACCGRACFHSGAMCALCRVRFFPQLRAWALKYDARDAWLDRPVRAAQEALGPLWHEIIRPTFPGYYAQIIQDARCRARLAARYRDEVWRRLGGQGDLVGIHEFVRNVLRVRGSAPKQLFARASALFPLVRESMPFEHDVTWVLAYNYLPHNLFERYRTRELVGVLKLSVALQKELRALHPESRTALFEGANRKDLYALLARIREEVAPDLEWPYSVRV